MRNPTQKHATAKSPSVTRQRDEKTGQFFLQGRETADKNGANVFADADYRPISAHNSHHRIGTEVIVTYCFFEGDIDDYGEVHSFVVQTWRDAPDGPEATIFINGEDFVAYQEAQWEEWAHLLREAVDRIRQARYNKVEFEPRLVGGPHTD